MTLANKEIRYKDIPTNFTVHPIRGDLIPITNEQAVIRSVRNILLTGKFERRFQPELCVGIRDYLFENMDDPNFDEVVRAIITERVSNREPRAQVLQVYVRARQDNNSVQIKLLVAIDNKPEPVLIDFILERVR